MTETLLEVRDLKKYFPVTSGLLVSRVQGWVKAVDGVSFTIAPGETFSLVGESGCGKTTTAKTILLLEKPTEGTIHFAGRDITGLTGGALKAHRASVQAVFQDPYSSLDPRKRVGSIIGEPLVVNHGLRGKVVAARVSAWPSAESAARISRSIACETSRPLVKSVICCWKQAVRVSLSHLPRASRRTVGLARRSPSS